MNEPNKTLESRPRFDWMQQTLREDPKDLFDVLAGTLGAELEPGRGQNGYHRAMSVIRAGETLARVNYGGPNGWPNVVTTGAATDVVEPVLRAAWEGQEVTRMDTAQDFDSDGGYDRVRAVMIELAEGSRLGTTEIESTKLGVRSRTLYLGSPSSRVRVRLYEKGRFEQQMGHADASSTWYRLEAQIRPTGTARVVARYLDATEAWGFSRWSRELASSVIGVEVDQVTMQLRRDPDYARALHFLERQYASTLRKAVAVEGSWEAVGRKLGVIA